MSWDPETSVLRFGDYWTNVIPKKAKGLCLLLTGLPAGGWKVETPLARLGPVTAMQVHNWIWRLNRKLATETPRPWFYWNGSGDGICCCVIGFKSAKGVKKQMRQSEKTAEK
jgi:hypothetical protein